jgi:hypothetical protein
MPAATFGALRQGDLDLAVGVPGHGPRPAGVAFGCAPFLWERSDRGRLLDRRGLGFIELRAVLGDFQLESALLFLELLDFTFQPFGALLQSPPAFLPPPVVLPQLLVGVARRLAHFVGSNLSW